VRARDSSPRSSTIVLACLIASSLLSRRAWGAAPACFAARSGCIKADAWTGRACERNARAVTLRTRPLRLWVGRPSAEVTVTQTRHGFSFGFPIDFRELRDAPDDLAFYAGIAADHTNLVVAETSLKWRVVEPVPGQFFFDLADEELAWARGGATSYARPSSRAARCDRMSRPRSPAFHSMSSAIAMSVIGTHTSLPLSRQRSADSWERTASTSSKVISFT